MNEIKKQTVLELSSVEKALVYLVPPLLGLVIGWFLLTHCEVGRNIGLVSLFTGRWK
ncbi:hypothetical protein O7R04_01285 [Bacillus velezensis]|nr:hypothetical protein O7R04_01285 [Bacillus velezensis]